jgi:hypothetical protein
MANLLIGSSNIYRFYKFVTKKEQKPYALICCTNIEVWNTTIDDIKMEKGEVIVSVIENLICDAVSEVTEPEARKIVIEDVVGSFLAQVKKCATEHPGVKFAMVGPMLRPKHQWYTEEHETICKYFNQTIKDMRVQNVARVDGPPGCTQVFTSDGIHLTDSSGKVFVETIISNSECFFKQEMIDLSEEMDTRRPDDPDWVAKRIEVVEKEIGNLNKQLKDRDRDIFERRIQDSLVTARIREELDFISNSKKEDKIVITGLTSKIPMPKASEEKRKWLDKIVGVVLEKIVPDSSKHVIFTSLGSRNSIVIPLVEVRLDSRELAMKIRKEFSAKKKSEKDFGKIFIANSVTLGTRVRIDILKAIAKKNSNEKEIMSVSAFVSRPVIHLRSRDGDSRLGIFNFSDALVRFGENLTVNELGEAYRRAGNAFRGQLQQKFVVLNEQCSGVPRSGGLASEASGSNLGSPRKRLRENLGSRPRIQGPENKTKMVKRA